MKQLYQNIIRNAVLINKALGEFGQIQKIYSSAFSIDLSIRANGKTNHLILGRGELFQGICLDEKGIPQKLRQRDKLLELLRAKLISRSFLGIETDSKDRAFAIKYTQARKENYFMFFYQGPKLYVACLYFDFDKDSFQLIKSWSSKKEDYNDFSKDIFEVFDEVGRIDLEDKLSISKEENPIQAELEKCEQVDNKKKKFIKRKISNIKQDLKKIASIDKLIEIAEKIEELEKLPKKTIIEGIKFNFAREGAFNRRDEIYQKVKKLKKGKTILEKRLLEAVQEESKLEEHKLLLPKVFTCIWGQTQSNPQEELKEKQGNDYTVYSFKTFSVGIGKSARGNDKLRSDWAKKTDFWFHLEQGTSPHIIIKGDIVLDENILGIVGGMFNTSLNQDHATYDIIYTQVKNLKGVKGSPGKVIYKKEKHQRIRASNDWKNFINHVDGN